MILKKSEGPFLRKSLQTHAHTIIDCVIAIVYGCVQLLLLIIVNYDIVLLLVNSDAVIL